MADLVLSSLSTNYDRLKALSQFMTQTPMGGHFTRDDLTTIVCRYLNKITKPIPLREYNVLLYVPARIMSPFFGKLHNKANKTADGFKDLPIYGYFYCWVGQRQFQVAMISDFYQEGMDRSLTVTNLALIDRLDFKVIADGKF